MHSKEPPPSVHRQETQTPVGFSFGTSRTLFKFSYNPVTAHQEVFRVVKLWGHIYHLALGILAATARCSFNLQLAPTLQQTQYLPRPPGEAATMFQNTDSLFTEQLPLL